MILTFSFHAIGIVASIKFLLFNQQNLLHQHKHQNYDIWDSKIRKYRRDHVNTDNSAGKKNTKLNTIELKFADQRGIAHGSLGFYRFKGLPRNPVGAKGEDDLADAIHEQRRAQGRRVPLHRGEKRPKRRERRRPRWWGSPRSISRFFFCSFFFW